MALMVLEEIPRENRDDSVALFFLEKIHDVKFCFLSWELLFILSKFVSFPFIQKR